jgi:hypothetical protein
MVLSSTIVTDAIGQEDLFDAIGCCGAVPGNKAHNVLFSFEAAARRCQTVTCSTTVNERRDDWNLAWQRPERFPLKQLGNFFFSSNDQGLQGY